MAQEMTENTDNEIQNAFSLDALPTEVLPPAALVEKKVGVICRLMIGFILD